MTWDKVDRRQAHGGEVLTACEKGWERFDEHCKESVAYRESSVKHTEQIQTLEKAHAQNMKNIEEIQKDIKEIRNDMSGIRQWVLGGVIAGITVVGTGVLTFYGTFSAQQQKIDFIYQHSYGVHKAIHGSIQDEKPSQ